MTRRWLILMGLFLLVSVPASAQTNYTGLPIVRAPSMTVSSVPLAFTAAQKIGNNGAQYSSVSGGLKPIRSASGSAAC